MQVDLTTVWTSLDTLLWQSCYTVSGRTRTDKRRLDIKQRIYAEISDTMARLPSNCCDECVRLIPGRRKETRRAKQGHRKGEVDER